MTHPLPVATHDLDSLGFDGRVWVDLDALVLSFRQRSQALGHAAAVEADPVAQAVLTGRAAELDGRADALVVALLDEGADGTLDSAVTAPRDVP